jgi:phosphoinositide-3-kinase regulatory subunit 4
MILAIETVHNHLKIFHGNIRTSNFLLTSYDYLMLTDFANYKPTYILEDTEQGLAEFRLFYPSSLEKCNLSPDKLQGRSESAMKISKPEYLFSLYKDS